MGEVHTCVLIGESFSIPIHRKHVKHVYAIVYLKISRIKLYYLTYLLLLAHYEPSSESHLRLKIFYIQILPSNMRNKFLIKLLFFQFLLLVKFLIVYEA